MILPHMPTVCLVVVVTLLATPVCTMTAAGKDDNSVRSHLSAVDVPLMPLAEILFARYNAHMQQGMLPMTWGESAPADDTVVAHARQNLVSDLYALYMNGHPVTRMADEMAQNAKDNGFCFISIGCWGAAPPHPEVHAKVISHVKDTIRNGLIIDTRSRRPLASAEGGKDSYISVVRGPNQIPQPQGDANLPTEYMGRVEKESAKLDVHFVIAAGDNMYMDGANGVWDDRLFTTFDAFTSDEDARNASGVNRVPWFVALGNHDYHYSPRSQVEYTFTGPLQRDEMHRRWRDSLTQKIHSIAEHGEPERNYAAVGGINLEQSLRGFRDDLSSGRRGVTGRWYMPYYYHATKVSEDTVVVVIDTVHLHICEVENKKTRKQQKADVDNDDADESEENGKMRFKHDEDSHIRKLDCEEQRRVVEQWLLEEYADVTYKIVVGHFPVMANGPHKNYKWLKKWLEPLMQESCASLYIHADNHYLQVSRDGLQYYVNSGGGAGNKGEMHSVLKGKNWEDEHSAFHSVEAGMAVHCVHRDQVLGTHLTSYMFGEDRELRYIMQTDAALLRECRRKTDYDTAVADAGRVSKKNGMRAVARGHYDHPGYGRVLIVPSISNRGAVRPYQRVRYACGLAALLAATCLAYLEFVDHYGKGVSSGSIRAAGKQPRGFRVLLMSTFRFLRVLLTDHSVDGNGPNERCVDENEKELCEGSTVATTMEPQHTEVVVVATTTATASTGGNVCTTIPRRISPLYQGIIGGQGTPTTLGLNPLPRKSSAAPAVSPIMASSSAKSVFISKKDDDVATSVALDEDAYPSLSTRKPTGTQQRKRRIRSAALSIFISSTIALVFLTVFSSG